MKALRALPIEQTVLFRLDFKAHGVDEERLQK
jgi:hypothetical protein